MNSIKPMIRDCFLRTMPAVVLTALCLGRASVAAQPTSTTPAGTTPAAAEPLVVRIGFSGSLTGPQAAIGQDSANAIRLALDELKREDVRIGGRPVVWKLDAQDDRADPKQAAIIAQHFIDTRVHGVVGPMNSGTVVPAVRLFERAGLPMVTPSATESKLPSLGPNVFFRVIADDEATARALARYAATDLRAKSFAVIDDRTAYGQGLADAFVAAARTTGLKPVGREFTSDQATDFTAILTRLKAARPDVIFFGGVYPQGGPMLRQIERLGIKTRLLGGDGMCLPALARLAGPATDLTICAEGGMPVSLMPRGRAWKQRYDAAFGADAYQVYSPYAYDATMLLAQAMVKAGSPEPAKYLPFLKDIGHDGVSHSNMHFVRGNLADASVVISGFEQQRKKMLRIEAVTAADGSR